MSGGSHNYIYSRLSQECEGEMHDDEMDDLIKDLCDVLHDLEWWQSGDYSEDQYRETLVKFKAKWLKGDRTNRLKGYIDDQLDAVRSKLYSLIGEEENPKTCIDCEHFSDKEYYVDNTMNVSAVSWGSCTKCQRNITSTSPHTEVPSWCPLKGDEDESDSNDN